MNIWNNFLTTEGVSYKFRRMHFAESYAGMPGIFALTIIEDFSVKALYFEAANELAAANGAGLASNEVYARFSAFGPVGVAVCLMRNSDAEQRRAVARDLNNANDQKAHEEAA